MNYIITYTAYDAEGNERAKGRVRVNNPISELHAKIKADEYLKSKRAYIDRIVIHSCQEEWAADLFNRFFT